MIFIRDRHASKVLENLIFPNDVENIFVELKNSNNCFADHAIHRL